MTTLHTDRLLGFLEEGDAPRLDGYLRDMLDRYGPAFIVQLLDVVLLLSVTDRHAELRSVVAAALEILDSHPSVLMKAGDQSEVGEQSGSEEERLDCESDEEPQDGDCSEEAPNDSEEEQPGRPEPGQPGQQQPGEAGAARLQLRQSAEAASLARDQEYLDSLPIDGDRKLQIERALEDNRDILSIGGLNRRKRRAIMRDIYLLESPTRKEMKRVIKHYLSTPEDESTKSKVKERREKWQKRVKEKYKKTK